MLPISAATIGVLFMGEQLTLLQWLAFGVALLGLIDGDVAHGTPPVTRTTDPSAG